MSDQQEQHVDRFGFIHRPNQDDDEEAKPIDKATSAEEIKVWMKLSKRIDKVSNRVLKARVRNGVPEQFRALVWSECFRRNSKLKKMSEAEYLELETKSSDCEHIIDLDVPRSFPNHKLFVEKDGNGQKLLRRALRAYSVRDTELGYCQGISFIMGALLMYFTETEAFWAFESLMLEPKYAMRKMYLNGLPRLIRNLFVFERLLEYFLPDLFELFTSNSIVPTMYASGWFMTIYLTGFPFEFSVRVFDVFFNEGEKILFRIGLGYLAHIKSEVLKIKDYEDILTYVRINQKNVDVDAVFKLAFDFSFSRSLIDRFDRKFNESAESKKK